MFHLAPWVCPKTVQPPRDEGSRWAMCWGILSLPLRIVVFPRLGEACIFGCFPARWMSRGWDCVLGWCGWSLCKQTHSLCAWVWSGAQEKFLQVKAWPKNLTFRLVCMILIKKIRHHTHKSCLTEILSSVLCHGETFLRREIGPAGIQEVVSSRSWSVIKHNWKGYQNLSWGCCNLHRPGNLSSWDCFWLDRLET